jgi:putative CocE/NonD family hydrolase
MLVERDVGVPMRDGVVLRADVYRPHGTRPVPAIVTRTPYDKSRPMVPVAALDPERAVEAAMALVCQDTRGRHASGGEFVPFVYERSDGYDTVEWTAAQTWCSGKVAMAGRSYGAATQWAAAIDQPPHLKAICPMLSGGERYDGWVYQGGAFQLGFNLFWAHLLVAPRKATRPAEQYGHLPLRSLPLLQECPSASFFADWLDHATNDDFWQRWALADKYARLRVPVYIIGGWFDLFLGNTLNSFIGARREGGSELTRQRHRLLIGPWGHGSIYGAYPDHGFEGFTSDESVDLADIQLRFFQDCLSDVPLEADPGPSVRIFVMGENRWRTEEDWPLQRTKFTRWFLHSEGDANHSGGSLSPLSPAAEPPDSYVYDPVDPAPTVGGPASLPALLFASSFGPSDQRRLEGRPDVLVYTSAALERAIEATGPLTVVLYAATSAPDTDFVAKLTDVTPSGESRILAEGILRASFRDGFDSSLPVEPEWVYAYTIDLVATSHVFLPGHRIRVDVTSSSFPRFDRNPNTGHALGTDGPNDLRTARQTIFHDHERPSHILLPIIPR